MNIKKVMKTLETIRKDIGIKRDMLRDLEGEISDLVESSDRALESLEDSISALSEYA